MLAWSLFAIIFCCIQLDPPSLSRFAASPQTHVPVEDDAVHVIKVVMCRFHF